MKVGLAGLVFVALLTPVTLPLSLEAEPKQESAAQVFSSKNEDWKSPELRIGVEEFKQLASKGEVLIVDVRDPESYRAGHLPGAVLLTPEELSTPEGQAGLKGERRTIVTYCS